jgi:hypothetical protein
MLHSPHYSPSLMFRPLPPSWIPKDAFQEVDTEPRSASSGTLVFDLFGTPPSAVAPVPVAKCSGALQLTRTPRST